MKTIKKAQTGGKLIDKPMPRPPKTRPTPTPPSKPMMKAKSGKSFPDLNKDGKITKADILKGRGVIAKNGKTVKKSKNGSSLGMKSVKAGFDKNPGVTRADIITAAKGKAKSGASMKKCKYGCK